MKRLLSAAVLAASLLSGAATASTVDVSYQDASNPFGSENLKKSLKIQSPGYDGWVNAGAFQMTGSGGFGDFTAFCVDVFQFLMNNQTYTSPVILFDMDIVDNIDRLFTSVYASVDTSKEAAAFQVALWEIIYDHGAVYDLDAGAFSMSHRDGVEALAEHYLAGLSTASKGGYKLTFLKSDKAQDLVTAAVVPLPASILFMLGGLGALASLRRYRGN